MKKLQLLVLFIFVNSFAQTAKIEKVDGSIITATKVEFSQFNEKLTYWVDKNKEKIDYSDLKSVSNVNYIFRYFPKAKKFKGMFVKAETKDKILGFYHYDSQSPLSMPVSDGTGKPMYPVTVKGWKGKSFEHIHLTIFDKQGNVLDDVDLRSGLEQHNIEERGAALDMIKRNFLDCPALINELDAFTKREEDPKNLLINFYFMQLDTKGFLYKYLECK
jgi:hypothetical protein